MISPLTEEQTREQAQNLANEFGEKYVIYPEPVLGENAWDLMSLEVFEQNGHELGEDEIVIEPEGD